MAAVISHWLSVKLIGFVVLKSQLKTAKLRRSRFYVFSLCLQVVQTQNNCNC